MEHENTFMIPAEFGFRPFSAAWRVGYAETVEWVEESGETLLTSHEPGSRLRIHVDLQDGSTPKRVVIINRASLPPGILRPHEDHRNKPDVSGLRFGVLICEGRLSASTRGVDKTDAWTMRREFLHLHARSDSVWIQKLCQFLNKWGLWNPDRGFQDDWTPGDSTGVVVVAPLLKGKKQQKIGMEALIVPHFLKKQQKKYNETLLSSDRLSWLRSHPLSLQPADNPPFFTVRTSYCDLTIQAAITLDFLSEKQFGKCKRCGDAFEKMTKHKKKYCSRPCINAAHVEDWRGRQPKVAGRNTKGRKLMEESDAPRKD